MSRLNLEQVAKEITDKGFKPTKIDHYRNLGTILTVECAVGHEIEESLANIRKASFRCPRCHGGSYRVVNKPPQKKGYRVIGIDNASQNMGLSIFDNGELVFQTVITFSGKDFEDRLQTIFNLTESLIMDTWDPDFIAFEDVQFQQNYATYKKLSMLLGVLIVAAKNAGVEYDIIPPVTWRSYYNISGKRATAKRQAVNKVATMYNITVSDDIAEAILIGKYFVDKKLGDKLIKKAF